MREREKEKENFFSVYKDMQIYALLTLTLCCWAFSEILATFQSHCLLGVKNDRAREEKRKGKGTEDNKERES